MPNNNEIRVIFIADIIGRYGRNFLAKMVPVIKSQFQPDVVIANGENIAGGLGITKRTISEVYRAGVEVVTGGNHFWDKKEVLDVLDEENQLIRPLNFPEFNPGRGYCFHKIGEKCEILVVNLQGRVFMEPVVNNPFIVMDEFLKQHTSHKVIIVDFHAEATAEKQAMGFFLDGRVSAMLGTHTHVPTADFRILKKGTAYQSDVGMVGSLESVIGMKKEPIIKKFLTGINQRFEVESSEIILDCAIIDINYLSGKATNIEYHRYFESDFLNQ